MTWAVRSDILATAGLLVILCVAVLDFYRHVQEQ